MKLQPTDLVIMTDDGTPLRYTSGEIGLWAKENIDNDKNYPDDLKEVVLEEGEYFLPSNKLQEPFKTELINQIKKYK